MIRVATADDSPAIRALLESSGLSTDAVGTALHLVAVDGAQMMGVAALERHGDYGLIRSVAVLPPWRRTGIASALVREVLRADVTAFYLFTESAEPFFARLGFRRIGRDALPEPIARSSQAATLCPVSATVMENRLRQR